MRESEKKKIQTNNHTKRPARTPRRETKVGEDSGRKSLSSKETQSKAPHAKPASSRAVSDPSVGQEPCEVYENVVIHYVDDAHRSEDAVLDPKGLEMVVKGKSDDLDVQQAKGEDSDYESLKDSSSSQGDPQGADDEKLERLSNVPKKISKSSSELTSRASRAKCVPHRSKSGLEQSHSAPNKPMRSNSVKGLAKAASVKSKSSGMKVHPSLESSEVTKEKSVDEDNDEDVFEEASNGEKSTESDDGTVMTEENDGELERADLKQKVELMENRIERLEEELREVAALEISLFSVIPDHGSSAHKVHTPARRLSRLYIHACKHWAQSKRATVARNTVSGLILVTRTCGNDVARLTFWLSNAVVLREIISQAFGISCHPREKRFIYANGRMNGANGTASSYNLKGHGGGKQVIKTEDSFEDWEETSTFTSALQKIESWIFSRVVESLWWQALTPNMLSPLEELLNQNSIGKLLGPTLGEQQQGNFSIELWKNAFESAFQRLCPVRSAGHECGCLPVLARMVMEQCISRLDVAMFNAILRESANQMPTDPVSDPIVDSRVLPIPAGEFSFGSGAQLKNAVGNWCRWFDDTLGFGRRHISEDHDSDTNDNDHPASEVKTNCFRHLNELSDLLMLPKDMLMDTAIREEVCPSINLDVIKRILCYFTPDEFCPDPVPGEVLEALNAESFVERKLARGPSGTFPYAAAAVLYNPPSSRDVSEKVAEAEEKSKLEKNVSMVQKKGYTSDEELSNLDSPLTAMIEPGSPSTLMNGKTSFKNNEPTTNGRNARYELLHEVWSV